MDLSYLEQIMNSEGGFAAWLGIDIDEETEERVTARVEVRDELKQPAGLVHGGVYASIAESITSMATGRAVLPEGSSAQGMANQTSFLRPILAGTIHAEARRLHRGRTTWVWEVEMRDDAGRLCTVTRMTVAVRPLPEEVRDAVVDHLSRRSDS